MDIYQGDDVDKNNSLALGPRGVIHWPRFVNGLMDDVGLVHAK